MHNLLLPIFLFITLFFNGIPSILCSNWNYIDQLTWPDKCIEGNRQSPINLVDSDLPCTSNDVFSLDFSDSSTLQFKYTESTWRAVSAQSIGSLLAQDIDGVIQKYSLEYFTVHSVSEHAISSNRYPLEIQFYFTLAKDSPNQTPDTRAVVSILYSKASDNQTSEFIEALDLLVEEENIMTLNIEHLISKVIHNHTNFFMYKGSDTQPPCEEYVNWFVLEAPIRVSEKQLEFFNKTYHQKELEFPSETGNARNLQDLNSRTVQKLCNVVDHQSELAVTNEVLIIAVLLTIVFAILYNKCGKRKHECDLDAENQMSNNLWTLHPLYSIVYVPSKDGYSRSSRIALLFIDWLTKLTISGLWYSTQKYTSNFDIFLIAVMATMLTTPVNYLAGMFYRRYYKHVRETMRKMHSDSSLFREQRFTFLGVCIAVAIVDIFAIYLVADRLLGELSQLTVYSFMISVVLEIFIIDPFLIFLSGRFSPLLPILKLKGYYYEGEIAYFNIMDNQ